MPRQKQFDRVEALDRATETFWRRGYEATSMADLLRRMGINRGSFYDTFKSKRAVLVAALKRYDAVHRRDGISSAARGRNPREAILNVFRCMIDGSLPQGRHGCFLVNSALELAPSDPEVARIVREGFKGLETFFTKLIRMGQAAGQIDRELDPAGAGRVLLNQLLGLMVLVRSRASRPVLESVVVQVERLLG